MDKTAGSGVPLRSNSGPQEEVKLLNWIHAASDPLELITIVRQIAADNAVRLPPVFLSRYVNESLVAAAYFRVLPGGVATLGGVRSLAGFEATASQLVSELARQLDANGICQIQSIVRNDDQTTHRIVAGAGFGQLTSVQQQWRETNYDLAPASLTWRPANRYTEEQLAAVLEQTFVDTKDCPELNGIRRPIDALEGFLEGKPLSTIRHWYVLREQDNDIGCLFLCPHSNEVAELVYMGLHPNMRGRGLGRILLTDALRLSRDLGARLLIAGVDDANSPALRCYAQLGFQFHQRLGVYMPSGLLQRLRHAA